MLPESTPFFDVGCQGLEPFRDAREHGLAGVLARRRQEILAVHLRLQVGAAQDRVQGVLEVSRLAFLDHQHRNFA